VIIGPTRLVSRREGTSTPTDGYGIVVAMGNGGDCTLLPAKTPFRPTSRLSS
jgi:hypothetical protein